VPRARFVFFSGTREDVTQAARDRLSARLADAGHDASHRMIVLPTLNESGFRGIGVLADVLLDSIGWSGFNTTIEIIDGGAPVVSVPGPFMRGCHTAAALTAIGLPDMVSADRNDYTARAIRLGVEPDLRRAERARLHAAVPRLYRDPRPIRALEALLADVCGAAG
jgi:predicted O-linked N-acetylglucosamine transferase (SPINDLY family)